MANGFWEGAERASGRALATGMKIMDYQQRKATEDARTKMMQEHYDVANAKANLEIDAIKKQTAAMEKPIDITTTPHFLTLPEEVRPQVLDFFSKNGYTNPAGLGKTGDVMRGLGVIDKTPELFSKFMLPVVQQRKNASLEAFNALLAAREKGDKNKIMEATAAYKKANEAYLASADGYYSHVEKIASPQGAGGGDTTYYRDTDAGTETFVARPGEQPQGEGWSRVKPPGQSITALSDEELAPIANAVVDLTYAPAELPKRGKSRAQMVAAVKEIKPDFNFTMADSNAKYRKDANILRSANLVNAVMPRVTDLYRKAVNLQNLTDVPILDEPLNKARRALGDEAVVDYESLRNAIIIEVNTALSGTSVASDERIKLELANLQSGLTVGQQMKSIGNLVNALESRRHAAQLNFYPKEVVWGEKSMEEWRKEQKQEVEDIKNMSFGRGPTASSPGSGSNFKIISVE